MSEIIFAMLLILRTMDLFFFVSSDNIVISAISLFQKHSRMISKSVFSPISFMLLKL